MVINKVFLSFYCSVLLVVNVVSQSNGHENLVEIQNYKSKLSNLSIIEKVKVIHSDYSQDVNVPLSADEIHQLISGLIGNSATTEIVDEVLISSTEYSLMDEIILKEISGLIPDLTEQERIYSNIVKDKKQSKNKRIAVWKKFAETPDLKDAEFFKNSLKENNDQDEKEMIYWAFRRFIERNPNLLNDNNNQKWLIDQINNAGISEEYPPMLIELVDCLPNVEADMLLTKKIDDQNNDITSSLAINKWIRLKGGLKGIIKDSAVLSKIITLGKTENRNNVIGHELLGENPEEREQIIKYLVGNVKEIRKNIGDNQFAEILLLMKLPTDSLQTSTDDLAKSLMNSKNYKERLLGYSLIHKYFDLLSGFNIINRFAQNENDTICKEFLSKKYTTNIFVAGGKSPFSGIKN